MDRFYVGLEEILKNEYNGPIKMTDSCADFAGERWKN